MAPCGTFPADDGTPSRKFDGYLHGFRAKLHTELFGWKSLRFLFITNSQGRADNMRDALNDLTHVPNERQLFYFTHADANADGNALADVWIDRNGQRVVRVAANSSRARWPS